MLTENVYRYHHLHHQHHITNSTEELCFSLTVPRDNEHLLDSWQANREHCHGHQQLIVSGVTFLLDNSMESQEVPHEHSL